MAPPWCPTLLFLLLRCRDAAKEGQGPCGTQ
jgi:hypothetical protein